MKKTDIICVVAFFLALILQSCTIFEERSGCPCYLAIDFSNVDNGIREWQLWLFSPDGELMFKDTVYRRSYTSPYIVQVPRNKHMQCLMWGNARGGTLLDETYSHLTSLVKREEIQADSLFFFTDTVNTWKEDEQMRVIPRKEFATVDVYMQGWIDIDFDAEMNLVCNSKGFYVDGKFYPGNVLTKMKMYDIGNYYTHFRGRILRQPDTENILLSLKIWKREVDGTIGAEIVNKDIPIGKYLEENGYDIQRADLGDIRMDVDYSYNSLILKAEDWVASYNLVEEI